jgi:hypothetical protein
MKTFVHGVLLLAVAMLASGPAHASKTFPQNIINIWGVKGSLPAPGDGCTLCHKTDVGGNATIDKPFGKTMQRYGLVKEDLNKLLGALIGVATDAADSDRDAVSDYVEVAFDHTNPNDSRSVVVPDPIEMPTGGAGGESAGGGASGEGQGVAGGLGGSTPGPPVFVPPPAADLPPPFEHGCALGVGQTDPAAAWLMLAALGFCTATRRQRHGASTSSRC